MAKKTSGRVLVAIVVTLLSSSIAVFGQDARPTDLEAKLGCHADFVPSDKSALDRLIAIAQHYQIPMGIESIEGIKELKAFPLQAAPATVRDLLTQTVWRLPDYQMTVQNGVVNIARPLIAARTDNVLNLVIEEFIVDNDDLFAANYRLGIAIEMTLHPEIEGYAGGYGHAPDHVFTKRPFTFNSNDLTVRQILDELAKANGNALWIATLGREYLNPKTSIKRAEEKLQVRFVALSEVLPAQPLKCQQ